MIPIALRRASQNFRRQKSGRFKLNPDRQAHLNKVAWRLAQSNDLAQVYRQIVDTVAELISDVSAIIVSRYDDAQKLMYMEGCIIEGRKVDPSGFPPIPLEPLGNGPQSEAILTHRTVLCNDFQARLKRSKVNISVGPPPLPLSAIFVPMIAGDKVQGVIQVQSYTAERFDAQHQAALELLADAAVIALRNAAQLDELRRKAKQLEEVARFSESLLRASSLSEVWPVTGQAALKLTAASRVAVFRMAPDGNPVVCWSRGFEQLGSAGAIQEMLAGKITGLDLSRQALPTLVEINLPPPIPLGIPARQYLAALPVTAGPRPLAVVACLFEQERQMSQLDADAVDVFTRQAKIALEKLDR